jgi:hypothetical protein
VRNGLTDHVIEVSLGQSYPAQQVGVARVGANSVPEWVNSEKDYVGGMLVVTFSSKRNASSFSPSPA